MINPNPVNTHHRKNQNPKTDAKIQISIYQNRHQKSNKNPDLDLNKNNTCILHHPKHQTLKSHQMWYIWRCLRWMDSEPRSEIAFLIKKKHSIILSTRQIKPYQQIWLSNTQTYYHDGDYKEPSKKLVVDFRNEEKWVLDLLNTVKVHTIIGPETFIGSELLGTISDKAKIPIFSFAGKSLREYPYLFQIKEDEISIGKSIVALVEYYKWRDVIFMHQDADHDSEILKILFESFQDKNIRITYRCSISASANNEQIIEELHKLMKFHTTVIIVDISPSLASKIFLYAKRLGMMSKDYAWIMTQKTIDVLQSTKFEVIESLQGALGFRPYIPPSRKLHYFTKRWNKKFSRDAPMLAIWAYDTIWALAESAESVQFPQNGSWILNEILKIQFKGMSGDFELSERKIITNGFEIVNAVDFGEKKVGYWTLSKGIRKTHHSLNDVGLDSGIGVEDVIWSGGSTTNPKGWILRTSNGRKLRIGVRTGLRFKSFVHAVYDNQTNVTTATGFSVDVFNTCIQALPYEVPYEFIPFANGSYDKLIEKVYNKDIDGVLGDSTILANRSELVDFTATYTDLGLGTLAKIKKKDIWIFLKPLDLNLWLTFSAFIILTGFVIWAIEAMNQEDKSSSSQGIGTILWLILLTIFFAQKEKLSSNLSRFVMFTWLIAVLILISSYTATLASLLTVEQFELASKGGIVGYHGGSFFGGVTVSNLNFTDSKQRSYYSYEDYADALTKGGKNGGADAIVDEVPYIRMFLGRYSNDYAMVSSEPTTSGFAFIFAKGLPLVTDMSREIAKIREDGTLRNLEKKWYETEFPVLPQDSSATPKTLSLERFGGLFVISGISSGLALMISVIYLVRAKLEIHNIILLVAGHDLMSIIRYLFHSNVIHR
ncbi:solute-binding protein family 3/N-terminal domain of MltF [Artemisia annua]|uniref:Glutamate receptor n=1 Tax=Artemisia annua TaxID=35608 RepID=A0A2U1MW65_ARTAN|nr:solute-binding protein family 3/N-terminal domain of MltF [Artemisia annua]